MHEEAEAARCLVCLRGFSPIGRVDSLPGVFAFDFSGQFLGCSAFTTVGASGLSRDR